MVEPVLKPRDHSVAPAAEHWEPGTYQELRLEPNVALYDSLLSPVKELIEFLNTGSPTLILDPTFRRHVVDSLSELDPQTNAAHCRLLNAMLAGESPRSLKTTLACLPELRTLEERGVTLTRAVEQHFAAHCKISEELHRADILCALRNPFPDEEEMNEHYNLTPQQLQSFIERHGDALCQQAAFNVSLSMQEVLANSIKHGICCDPRKSVTVHMGLKQPSGHLVVLVEDEGKGYDFEKYMASDACLLEENLDVPSGRGHLLCKVFAQSFTPLGKGNMVRLEFGYEPATRSLIHQRRKESERRAFILGE